MIDSIDRDLCTGCGACANICPQGCIAMTADHAGFLYPVVDNERCKKCGKCVATCPSLNNVPMTDKWTNPQVFAAWSLDDEIRFNSTSGGVFSELSKKILSDGGVVAAAKYSEANLAEHCIIESADEIVKVRQSKYIQSDIGFVYQAIRQKLLADKQVGFCGTPCQVAGLLNFLGKPYDNLITFDFVCRGTNSPAAYLKYLDMLEKKYKSKVKKVWFKNKTHGWNRFSTRIDFENGQTYLKDRFTDLFMRGYIEENLYMRSCCFACRYRSFPRLSDITLADFWGVRAVDPALDTDQGTSLIMLHSDKGRQLFDSVSEAVFSRQSSIEEAFPGNRCISESAVRNPKSETFMKLIDEYPFDVCFRKCVKNNLIKRSKREFSAFAGKMKKTLFG